MINMDRGVRRDKTAKKLHRRLKLMLQKGLQGGSVYKRHREKILFSAGYMRTGNVTHYVRSGRHKKTRSRDRYGSVYDPSRRDAVQLDAMDEQETEERNEHDE